MFKSLKDVRRRVVESVLENVGASERTVDEEFDLHFAKFGAMMSDMNECGAANHSSLTVQKTYFQDAVDLASFVAKIHNNYENDEYWPGTTSHLSSIPAARKYQEVMQELHTVYRSSSALTAMELGIEPLREAIAEIGPHVESAAKDRTTQLIDYDSYRRRLKGLREKREYIESQGKSNTSAGQENLAEIAKFEGKEHVAKELYEQKNEALKTDIIECRARHDALINDLLVSVVVAQAELFRSAAQKLDEVIAHLPPEKVDEVRAAIHKVVGQGGVQVAKEEKTKLQKGLMIFSGKAVPSDFKPKDESTASAPAAAPAAKGRSASMISLPTRSASASASAPANPNPFAASGNPFGSEEVPSKIADSESSSIPSAPAAPAAPAPPAPPAPPAASPAAKKVTVVALYDHEAEAEDELNFKVGDVVEVLETGDDGWWKGRCHGKEGLFPVNYVEAQP